MMKCNTDDTMGPSFTLAMLRCLSGQAALPAGQLQAVQALAATQLQDTQGAWRCAGHHGNQQD